MSTAAKIASLLAAADNGDRIARGTWGGATWRDAASGEIVSLRGDQIDMALINTGTPVLQALRRAVAA